VLFPNPHASHATSTFRLVEADHTAAGPGIRPEEGLLAEDAVADQDIGLAAAVHIARPEGIVRTGLVAVADRTGLPEDLVRTGLAAAAVHIVPAAERHIGLVVGLHTSLAAVVGRNLAVEDRRNGLVHQERRTRRLEDGWSSRPWSRSCGRSHRGGA